MDLAHEVTHQMMVTNHLHRRITESKISGTHLHRAQHRLLMMIAKNNKLSQVEIAKSLQVSSATVAVSLKKLEKDGYITRNINDDDNRINDLQITEQGLAVVTKSKVIFQEMEQMMISGFTEEELLTLIDYFKRIRQNLGEKEWRNKEDERI